MIGFDRVERGSKERDGRAELAKCTCVRHSKSCSKDPELMATRDVQEKQPPLPRRQPTMRFEELCSERLRRQRFCRGPHACQDVSYPAQCIRTRVLITLTQVFEQVVGLGETASRQTSALSFELKARPPVVNPTEYGKHVFLQKSRWCDAGMSASCPKGEGMIVAPRPVMAAYDLGTESGFPLTGRDRELIPATRHYFDEQ